MFRSRITHWPIAYDSDAGAAAVTTLGVTGACADLIRGTAGCSPFLAGLMRREADWLADIWDADPDIAVAALLQDISDLVGDPKSGLRQAKRRAALLVGLAEIGGVWPVMTATAAWTQVADAALARAMAYGLARHAKGPVTGDGGLTAFAMGKMGAGELNYSSDIDLVLLFDEGGYDPADYGTARAIFLKATRTAMAQLSDITAEGYVFRTDLRLRPDPGSTPIVLSMEAAERYYEAMGRTWERAAWIKARPAAGAVAAGDAFCDRLTPFIWRRHLDFAVVEEALEMRRRIRDHKGLTGEWDIPGHDVKLGQGGIREIEFLTQTQQIIAGGRDPSLRVRGTLDGLDRLVAAGWVAPPDRDRLGREYRYLRHVEHRLQMVQDAQTHTIPKDAPGLDRLARFMGQGDTAAFVADLRDRMRAVAAVTEPQHASGSPEGGWIPGASAVTARWATYPALRSDRARAIFDRLEPTILSALARAARPSEALASFDAFLRHLPAGVQVFSLFEANPKLVELVADICATAPDLARHLARDAGVLDAVIGGAFFAQLPAVWTAPRTAGDFEERMSDLRLWHREAHFRTGVHLLRALVDPPAAAVAYAGLAESTLREAWDMATDETVRRYGRVPGLRLAALGMGSLGVGRLTAHSDLDMVILHDGAGGDARSDGPRVIGSGQWAAKFAQVLITALSAPTGDGRLYEVDMRLRPSGRQGPVATPLSGFRDYHANEAWVWEHMALTRARPVAGDPDLMARSETARRAILADSRHSAAAVRTALGHMRARLIGAGRRGQGLSVKSGPGRLQDIELAAQAHALIAGDVSLQTETQLSHAGWLGEEDRTALAKAHALMAALQQVLRLLTPDDPPGPLGKGGEVFVAETLGMTEIDRLVARCDAAAIRASGIIDRALGAAGVKE